MELIRRIGSTKYIVKVHFDENGTQTLEDRILRLISHETLANGGKRDIILSPQRGRPKERTAL
ncbi:MAG: transposon-encoded TnpW family protein [Clostridia bacterium]|nr:transposon-encoded TnpW family protein [Clostridia bacterium]